jgi:uncharacterized protein (DUF983 family)
LAQGSVERPGINTPPSLINAGDVAAVAAEHYIGKIIVTGVIVVVAQRTMNAWVTVLADQGVHVER